MLHLFKAIALIAAAFLWHYTARYYLEPPYSTLFYAVSCLLVYQAAGHCLEPLSPAAKGDATDGDGGEGAQS